MANAMVTVGTKVPAAKEIEIENAAKAAGLTKASWITQAINEKMARENLFKEVEAVVSDSKNAIAKSTEIGTAIHAFIEKFADYHQQLIDQQKESLDQQKEIISLLNEMLGSFSQG